MTGDKKIRFAFLVVFLRDGTHASANEFTTREHDLNVSPIPVVFGVAFSSKLRQRVADGAIPGTTFWLPPPIFPRHKCRE